LPTGELAEVFWAVARDGDRAVIAHRGLLAALGLREEPVTAQQLWRRLAEMVLPDAAAVDASLARPLATILEHGPLARRLLTAMDGGWERGRGSRIFAALADCLVPGDDAVFSAAARRG